MGRLAPLLGLTEGGVRAMIRRGEIPASKLGRQYVIRRDALEARLKREERRACRRPTGDAVDRFQRALPPKRRRRISWAASGQVPLSPTHR